MMRTKRLQRELTKLQTGPLAQGLTLVRADDLETWLIDMSIPAPHPLYANATFRLQFTFSASYPIEAPEVVFIRSASPPRDIPLHPHIYSNGIICLDLLASQGWSPVQNAESVALSVMSMLVGNSKGERPPGDAEFVRSNTRRPRDVNFVFHDQTV